MSASAIGKPLGQPSRMTPTAGPWLSPNVAILNREPNWLDMGGKILCGAGTPCGQYVGLGGVSQIRGFLGLARCFGNDPSECGLGRMAIFSRVQVLRRQPLTPALSHSHLVSRLPLRLRLRRS